MIRIGDFSKLSRVSVKTLRFYDEMGLLKPIEVDRFTGYRYYEFDQLPRLYRILALKDLGFSLEEMDCLRVLKPKGICVGIGFTSMALVFQDLILGRLASRFGSKKIGSMLA